MSISTIATRFGGVSLAAALLFGPGVAGAQNAHYLSFGPASLGGDDGLDYTLPFRETGLGNAITVANYTLSVPSVSVTYQCFNHGGNAPQAAAFTATETNVDQTQSFPSRNGNVTGTIIVQEPEVPSTQKCTGGGSFCALNVSWSAGTLTDPYGNQMATPANDSGAIMKCGLPVGEE